MSTCLAPRHATRRIALGVHLLPMRRQRVAAAAAVLVTCLALTACGGGAEEAPPPAPAPSRSELFGIILASPSAGALTPAPAGLSGQVVCDNMSIGALRLDSVVVPAGAACELEGTVLSGGVSVGSGASLTAWGLVSNGNVQAQGAAHVVIDRDSRIAGSVQLGEGQGGRVLDSRIGGDVQIERMSGGVQVSGNTVAGNVQVRANLTEVRVERNTITGNLQCESNQPAPLVDGNVAQALEGQCLPPVDPGTGGGGTGGTGGGSGPVLVPAPEGLRGDLRCDGLRVGAQSVDTLTVPAGALCELQGTTVRGNLVLEAGASLLASDIDLGGNLQADAAQTLRIDGDSVLRGSVQLTRGGDTSLQGVRVAGDLQFDAMTGMVTLASSGIAGNVQVMTNLGGVTLLANRVGGNLQCKDNLPAPTGSGNTAAAKQDQCRGL